MGQIVMAALRQRTAAAQPRQPRSPVAWLFVAYGLLAVLLAAPLLFVEVPLGVDTLSHLARVHVRAHIADDPDLARLFEVRDALVPYMGLDWLVTPLARVMPTLVAGRVATALLLWGVAGAVLALQRAFTGRTGAEPLLVGLVSYNALMGWGFLNYVLGVIGALLGLAAWHALRQRSWLLRLGVFAALATGLYFVHLLALAVYGAMLGAYELFGRPRAWRTPARDWLLLGAQFLPAAMLWAQLAMTAPNGETGMVWFSAAKPLALTSPFLFGGVVVGLAVGTLVSGVCVAVLFLIFLLFRLTRTGTLCWDRRLAAPATALALLSLVMPTRAFGVFLVDMRFPVVAACLAIAAIRVAPGRGRRLLPLGGLLAVAALMQVGSAGMAMRACDRQYGELRAALQSLPRGSTLTSVQETEAPSPGVLCASPLVYDHMPQLVTLERSGYSPDFFARVTAVTVRDGRPTDQPPQPAHLFSPEMLPPSGYLLWMHLGHARSVPPGLTLLRSGSFFDLFSIP